MKVCICNIGTAWDAEAKLVNIIGTIGLVVKNIVFEHFQLIHRHPERTALHFIIIVLKGDMSIVGPRPLMQVSFDIYNEEVKQKIYLSKPGITGIGSVVFRDEEKIVSDAADPKEAYRNVIYPYKGQLELWYLENASMLTDIKIIFLTGWSIIFPKHTLTTKLFKNLPARPF